MPGCLARASQLLKLAELFGARSPGERGLILFPAAFFELRRGLPPHSRSSAMGTPGLRQQGGRCAPIFIGMVEAMPYTTARLGRRRDGDPGLPPHSRNGGAMGTPGLCAGFSGMAEDAAESRFETENRPSAAKAEPIVCDLRHS